MTRSRGTLASRISLLCVAIAVVTALLAGALAAGLIRSADQAQARRKLAGLATAVQASTETPIAETPGGQRRLRRALAVLGVQYAAVGSGGSVSGEAPLARAALGAADVAAVLRGESVSAVRKAGSRTVYLEARPTTSGGVVLAQPRTEAIAVGDLAIRRLIVALLVAAGLAAALGLLVAWRVARPLKRTAAAAHALAEGRRDVTIAPDGPAEVAEVAEAVNTLSGALAVSEGRQRDFLMSVSHELRTPLTAITGYAESLAEGIVPPEQSAAVGTVLLGEARRLDRLVSDLLDLARLDAQDFRIVLADVDLVALAHDAARVWVARCAGAGVHFVLEAPAAPQAPVVVRTDAARLRQVLDGLLENALRVVPSGAPIVLALRPNGGDGTEGTGSAGSTAGRAGAVVEVRDGGPGLSDSDLAVAFDRAALFQRYQGVRRVGTGLGLAIVAGLVSRLGGRIEAGHAPEGGARFTVHLPAGAAATR